MHQNLFFSQTDSNLSFMPSKPKMKSVYLGPCKFPCQQNWAVHLCDICHYLFWESLSRMRHKDTNNKLVKLVLNLIYLKTRLYVMFNYAFLLVLTNNFTCRAIILRRDSQKRNIPQNYAFLGLIYKSKSGID